MKSSVHDYVAGCKFGLFAISLTVSGAVLALVCSVVAKWL